MTAKITKGHVHIDVGTLRAPKKQDNGWLRVDAYLTRSGVFPYLNADGTKRLEYRPDEEVFNQDSLNTLHSLPVTDLHPPGLLDATNASDHSRGSLGEQPRRDGDMVASSMLITDAALVGKVERGDSRQVSAGYTCDLEWTPGVTPKGERYDAIQRSIKYNHAAVLPRGRAGADVRVRMDAAELDVVLDPQPAANLEQKTMQKIRIDGIDYEAGSEAAVQALAKFNEKVRADAAAKDQQIADLILAGKSSQAKFDEAIKSIDQLKKDAAEQPAKIRAEIETRAALEGKARKVLGSKVKLDGVDQKAIQLKVISKLAPKAKMDGKSDAAIDARFDSEIERFDASADSDVERQDGDDVTTDVDPNEERADGEDTTVRLDADVERAKNVKGSAEMWKRPIGATLNAEGRGLKVVRS